MEIIMPKIGDAMTEWKVLRWYKKASDAVKYGEAIERRGPRIDRPAPPANVVEMPQGDGGRKRSSPLARKVARELGVSLDQIQGSGPQGRIIAADVKGANVGRASARPAAVSM